MKGALENRKRHQRADKVDDEGERTGDMGAQAYIYGLGIWTRGGGIIKGRGDLINLRVTNDAIFWLRMPSNNTRAWNRKEHGVLDNNQWMRWSGLEISMKPFGTLVARHSSAVDSWECQNFHSFRLASCIMVAHSFTVRQGWVVHVTVFVSFSIACFQSVCLI